MGIPAVRDRVVQMAAKIVIEPIFEADFRGCSLGSARGVGAPTPWRSSVATERGHCWVMDADIQGFFDAIDHDLLMEMVCERISDRACSSCCGSG